mmetsp:Transcript_41841/g.99247  ORF Transcript_41841/g.99247 Transcript_41841/m.99247 type:complete len:398 (-) Transcript_41841:197-1390(-)
MAVEASLSLAARDAGSPIRTAGASGSSRCEGRVAAAFQQQLRDAVGLAGDAPEGGGRPPPAAGGRSGPVCRQSSGSGNVTPTKRARPGPGARGSPTPRDDSRNPKRPKGSPTSTPSPSGLRAASGSPISISLGSFKEPRTEEERRQQHEKRVKKAEEHGYDSGPAKALSAVEIDKALSQLKQSDSRLARVIAQIGPPTGLVSRFGGDPFPSLAKSIIYQQLSTKAAATIYARFEAACKSAAGGVTPEAAAALSVESLRAAGLSSRKAEYVKLLAHEFKEGRLSSEVFATASDAEVLALLLGIKGFGEWSANMFMMFNLGRADVLPVGDLAVRKAFKRLYGCRADTKHDTAVADHVDLPSRREMEDIAESWRPYRTVGSWYMWHVVETAEAAYTYGES